MSTRLLGIDLFKKNKTTTTKKLKPPFRLTISQSTDFTCSCCDLSIQNEPLHGDVLITAGSVASSY